MGECRISVLKDMNERLGFNNVPVFWLAACNSKIQFFKKISDPANSPSMAQWRLRTSCPPLLIFLRPSPRIDTAAGAD